MSNVVPITVAYGDGIGPAKVSIEGIDVYVAWPSLDTNKLAAAIQKANGGVEIVKTETLRSFNGDVGSTLSQGQ
jgi:hypothetical protein